MIQACINSLEDALACCNRIGYPVMLKASWGGGGKGIRKVTPSHIELVTRTYTFVSCQKHAPWRTTYGHLVFVAVI